MSSANRYTIKDKIKLVYFVLPDGKTYSKISFDGFLNQIYKKRVNPAAVTVESVTVEILNRAEHNKKDVGFFARADEWECENQITYYRKDSLYLLGLIPINKYDYEWIMTFDDKMTIKGFDAKYVENHFSQLDKRFEPLLSQVRVIL